MNLINNLDALTQTHFDSGALGGLAAVVHRLADAGLHPLTILQSDKPVQSGMLEVQGTQTHAAIMPGGMQAASVPAELYINLGSILSDLAVAAAGYAVFHAPAGILGFAAQLHAPGAVDQSPIFDSRQLGHDDIYATTIFRPGRYTLINTVNKVQGQIRVSYPVISGTPYAPPAPLSVQLDEKGFTPSDIQLMPAQGIVIHINNTQARITIDLVEADDGPKKKATLMAQPGNADRTSSGYRWVKPGPPTSGGA